MPIYNEVVRSSGVDRKNRYILRDFEQPAYRRLIGELYRGWSSLTYPVLKRIEKPLRCRHLSRCHGCTWAYDSRLGERVRVCGYIPLTSRQDLRHFDLTVKGRIQYRQCECELQQARPEPSEL